MTEAQQKVSAEGQKLTIVFPAPLKNGMTPARGTKVLDQHGNEIGGISGIELKA